MFLRMPGKSYHGPLPPLNENERIIHDQLIRHVVHLAGKIGERNIWHQDNLDAAARYIKNIFCQYDFTVSEQVYTAKKHTVKNIIAETRGTTRPDEIIVIGAHYDTVFGSPGADDNASGIAGLLELARILSSVSFDRTLRLIAFVNEETPFFYTRNMGSLQYARQARQDHENIVAMLSLESIGYFSQKRNTQLYPMPFGFFYPDTGNFIGFVSNLRSKELVYLVIDLFRRHAAFPSEGVATMSWVMGVGWSDQWAFWRQGYQAIMVTDTALFRNPHYHSGHDKPETLDYYSMAHVISGLVSVISSLGGTLVLKKEI